MKKSNDPSTWSEEDWKNHNKPSKDWNTIEWANVYKLYCATQLWELDESLELEDFKQKVKREKKFADLHRIKPGMDKPDYDPWRTAENSDTLQTLTCEFTNENGTLYNFIKREDNSVDWFGDFNKCILGNSEVYKEAYKQYCVDTASKLESPMHIQDFISEINRLELDKAGDATIPTQLNLKYSSLVYSDPSFIQKVTPPGGPSIARHDNLGELLGCVGLSRLCVSGFERINGGFKILTYGAYDHLADHNLIGGLTV